MSKIKLSHEAAAMDLGNFETDFPLNHALDEIDAVLEKNAEEFVKGFIQKGGQ